MTWHDGDIERFDEYLPTCSGASGTRLDRRNLDFEGRRFLATAERGCTVDPIRVYAGSDHGDARERASAAVESLVGLGAGDRGWLVVGAPTGRGWFDHVLVRALERLVDGDVATVVSQFGASRSISSTRQVSAAAHSIRELLERVRGSEALAGPRLLVVGESFGAWTLVHALEHVADAGPHAVALVATPGVAGPYEARLAQLERAGTRVVRLARPDDPVVAFPGISLAWRPSRQWRPADGRRWWPVVTALRALRAIDDATRFDRPWLLDDSRHDYRTELARVAADLVAARDDVLVARLAEELARREREESSWCLAYGPEPPQRWPGPSHDAIGVG